MFLQGVKSPRQIAELIRRIERYALQRVVTDLRRGVERLLDVALLEHLARTLRVVRPHTGKAIGLQLQPH
jgi:hypothetical protein